MPAGAHGAGTVLNFQVKAAQLQIEYGAPDAGSVL